MANKLTDNDIIKAMEYCVEQGITSECKKCKLKKGCRREMIATALNLINQQKAEIEKLKVEMIGMRGAAESYKIHYEKSEAYNKELWAERNRICESLQETKSDLEDYQRAYKNAEAEAINTYFEEVTKRCIESGIYPVIVKKIMEDVRKEMVGE